VLYHGCGCLLCVGINLVSPGHVQHAVCQLGAPRVPSLLFPQNEANLLCSPKNMSKRELGKLASVVDVDAPRTKRRREVAPHDEKKPDSDTADHNALGGANVKQEQEDPAKLEQVKEQGLKLWQTVKDAVDKECVTGPALCVVLPLTAYSHQPWSSQWPLPFSRFSPPPQQTHVPRLLHCNQEAHRP